MAYVNVNGGEVSYTYTFSGGDARTLVYCAPTTEVVSMRMIQQTASTVTLGFIAKPGTVAQTFDFPVSARDRAREGSATRP
jgi:hypothetical protein